MITCQHARHLFDSYLDGELSASLQTELHAHRLNCTACQNELALLEACGDVIAMDRREPEVSGDFTSRVLMGYRSRPVVKPHWFGRLIWRVGAPLAAAASIALVMSVTIPRSNRPGTATLGATVRAPDSVLPGLLKSGNQNPAALTDLQKTPPMSEASFFDSVRVTYDSACEGIRHGGEGWGLILSGLSDNTHAKFAALGQYPQKEKTSAFDSPDQASGAADPTDPSYLNSPPAAPGPDAAEGDSPPPI